MLYSKNLDISYSTEWGGAPWSKLTHKALQHLLQDYDNFKDMSILELGPRSGKMSCLLAKLGAQVTALDLHEESFPDAYREAQQQYVSERVEFKSYDGDLSILPSNSYDLFFSKSVFFAIQDHHEVLSHIQRILRPGGRAAFIENGYGNGLIHWLRKFKHRQWDYSEAHFLKEESLTPFKEIFHIDQIERTLFPPIYCICATNAKTSSLT